MTLSGYCMVLLVVGCFGCGPFLKGMIRIRKTKPSKAVLGDSTDCCALLVSFNLI